ncbi:MAG: cell division protein FtsA [Candidatus Pacebacteria bacterium]|nr:cell division protein FtsA [Candidatus Paceibacterota bacterium]
MFKPNNIIAGLDIGTGFIKILVASKNEDATGFEVVAQFKEPSFGVRRGVVIDINKVTRIIQILLNKVREQTGQKIESVFVNIGGCHLFCSTSKGMVAVSRADQRISELDVNRVIESARTVSLPSNNEILEVFPREFIVDNERGIKEVIGMQGGRVEVEALILAAFSPYVNNLTQAVLNSDIRILDIVPSVTATSLAVLSPKQKELGVALLDIGAGTSELAVFEEGELIHLAIFPMGSSNITNDIAIGLKIDIDTAEIIKTERGTCFCKGSEKKEKIEVEGESPVVFSQKMLAKIIGARVSEIFGEVQKELKKISRDGLLPAGMVLSGGGAKMPGIVELAKKELKLPCRIGKPLDFLNLDDDLSFASACGLIVKGEDLGSIDRRPSVSNFGERVKKFLKIFIP